MSYRIALVLAAICSSLPFPAQAQAPTAASSPSLVVGTTIYDPNGAEVGKIDSLANGVAVVSTGTQKVGLPMNAFGAGPKGPLVGMTKSELEAAALKASNANAAALSAQLVPGTAVHGVGGENVVGSIKAVGENFVVLTTPKGDVRLAPSAFGNGPNGLIIGMSAGDFEKAVAASQ